MSGGNQSNAGLATVHQGAVTVAVSPQATSWVYSNYDNPATTANLTSRRIWDSYRTPSFLPPLSAADSIEKTFSYDGFGNPTGQGGASVASNLLMDSDGFYPVTITSGSGGSNPDGKNLRLDWHRPTGLLKSIKDVSKQTLTTMTYDALGRPKQVTEGLKSGASLRLTEYSYDDLARIVVERRDLRVFGDGLLKTVTHYDQLGRPRMVRTVDGEAFSETSEASGIKQESSHRWLAAGREELTSNPYRSLSDATAGWTCTRYDKLGRVTITAQFAGSALPGACDAAGALQKVTTAYGDLTPRSSTERGGQQSIPLIDSAGSLR